MPHLENKIGLHRTTLPNVGDGEVTAIMIDANGRIELAGYDRTVGTFFVSGNIDHDGVDAGYPIKIGGRHDSPLPADVASGDRTNIQTDAKGRIELANYNRVSGAGVIEQVNEHSATVSAIITFLNAVVADTTSAVFDNQMFYKFGHIHATVTTGDVAGNGKLYIEASVDGTSWGTIDSWTVAAGAADTYEQPFAIVAPYNKIRIRWDEVADITTCTVKGIFRGA